MNKSITVFTPTYNRGYILKKLYDSLILQTLAGFEWLVVDDGSNDNTKELVDTFISENKIAIRYFKKENGGKHTAINYGLKKTRGDFFFIVDSDDILTTNAIERVNYYAQQIKNNADFAGVCGLRAHYDGSIIGGNVDYTILDCNSFDYRYKYKINGDTAIVFKTDILKNYTFPEIEGEKFIAEGYIWNKIACNYKLRHFNEAIYLCEYLKDGLSNASLCNRMKYNKMSTLYYSELHKMPIPLKYKIIALVNYWRFSFCSSQPFLLKLKQVGILSFPLLPFGYCFHLKDKAARNRFLNDNHRVI